MRWPPGVPRHRLGAGALCLWTAGVAWEVGGPVGQGDLSSGAFPTAPCMCGTVGQHGVQGQAAWALGLALPLTSCMDGPPSQPLWASVALSTDGVVPGH